MMKRQHIYMFIWLCNCKIPLGIIHCLMLHSYLVNLLLLSASNSMHFYLMIMHVHHCSFIPTWAAVPCIPEHYRQKWDLNPTHHDYCLSSRLAVINILALCCDSYPIWIHTRLSPSFFIFHLESYRTRLPSFYHFAWMTRWPGNEARSFVYLPSCTLILPLHQLIVTSKTAEIILAKTNHKVDQVNFTFTCS